MEFIKVSLVLGLAAVACADVNEIVGNNQYLPPKQQGYNYDRPSPAFPSSPRPTPSYRPPAPSSPAYQSPTPSYQAPSPTPAYRPPQQPQNVYGAPANNRPVITRPSAPGPIYTPSPSGPNGVSIAPGGGDHDHHHDHHEPGMPYDFEYKVKDDTYGTDYSRNEVSDGDVIRGEYRVQLPDGRLQIVKYTADWKNGYNADVSYQGEAQYPALTGAGSSGSGNYAPYPAAGTPSNSYSPPAPSAPSNSYGPPRSGY